MSNTSSILVTGDSSGTGKGKPSNLSPYLSGSDRLAARGRSRFSAKAVMALIALTAMAAAVLAVPASADAAPASTKLVWIPRGGTVAVPGLTAPASTAPTSTKLVWIPRAGYRIAAFVHPGRGPAIVLCHGFPDNHHLYDSVVPLLKGHEVVTFDFLGWGQSSKPAHYDYTFAGQEKDLNAVIRGLHLGRVVLVAHDASVPAVLNWAVDHPSQTASIILSNGFYAPVAGSGPPTLATIFALGQYPNTAPLGPLPPGTAYGLNSLMNGLSHDPRLLGDLLTWQESTFVADPSTARKFAPLFTQQFLAKPSTLGPLRSLAGNLFSAVAGYDAARVPSLKSLTMPVHIIWGARDPNLALNVADALHQEIPHSTLTVFPNAHHNLMLDDRTQYAADIRSAAAG
jgi:pimeloyl-ACP methyl ester carboxylesterase